MPDDITRYYTASGRCELCNRHILANFATPVCHVCVPTLGGIAPEAAQRNNDFSDVRRILLELAS